MLYNIADQAIAILGTFVVNEYIQGGHRYRIYMYMPRIKAYVAC